MQLISYHILVVGHRIALYSKIWSGKLGRSREGTDWAALLQISVAYRLIGPGREWKLHRHGYDQSAMGDLLGGGFHWGGKDQLYEVLDQLLLYDLASAYFEPGTSSGGGCAGQILNLARSLHRPFREPAPQFAGAD